MKATQELHNLGQSLWLDNITRGLLTDGTLARYINELVVTGLTSNPTIFDQAIRTTAFYDDDIRKKSAGGKSTEDIFFELAIDDLTKAAELFRPDYDATGGIDGVVSLEVSPLLADDAEATIHAAQKLHAQANCPNLLIKIPGTAAGVQAIEETICAGVPVNVTLLFSCEHYLAAAQAYLRGIERRIDAELDPQFRWDHAISDKVPAELRNRLGIAVAQRTYKAYCELYDSPRWSKLAAAGARPQRLLWASTGSKDPNAPDTLYVEALAAPETINTIPEKTLLAFADHGKVAGTLPTDGGDAEKVLAAFRAAGIDDGALAAQLQREGAESFNKSWHSLMQCIVDKGQSKPTGTQAEQH